MHEPQPAKPLWLYIIIGVSCALLVALLKVPGLIISMSIIASLIAYARLSPSDEPLSKEISSLNTSIRLASEEISEINTQWQQFLNSSDRASLADRTLSRPALADPDCADPDIEKFHFDIHNATRFLSRLDARLEADLTAAELRTLLKVTDERALEVRESWLSARRAALHLGPDYN